MERDNVGTTTQTIYPQPFLYDMPVERRRFSFTLAGRPDPFVDDVWRHPAQCVDLCHGLRMRNVIVAVYDADGWLVSVRTRALNEMTVRLQFDADAGGSYGAVVVG